jgi:iron complex outermembrane recepter protein
MGTGANPAITIRGRKSATRTVGTEAGVGVYVDGVFRTRVGSNLDLMQVEQVDVLRGPQGTLYGKNTISGAINVVSKKPGDEFKGGLGTSIGNLDRQDAAAFIEGPLTDNLSAN